MVELKVDVSDLKELSDSQFGDCFVSVRVGETQKLSRLAASRVYLFPKAGDRHYGKIEVYKRIGQCAVDIDPINEGDRQVNVSCGAMGALKLNVAINPGGVFKEEDPPKVVAAKEKDPSVKSKAARDYLRMHSIELQLSEAMQAVLKEQPADPITFLAEKLLNHTGVVLPPRKEAKVASEAKAAPVSPVSKPVLSVQPTKPAQPAKPAEPSLDVAPFAQYYTQHFVTLSMPTTLFDRFRTEPVVAAGAPSAQKSTTFGDSPFGEYFKQNFNLSPMPNDLWAHFPGRPRVELQAPSLPGGSEALGTTARDRLWTQKPSVGTWLSGVPPSLDAPALSSDLKPRSPPNRGSFVVSSGVWGAGMQLGLSPRMVIF